MKGLANSTYKQYTFQANLVSEFCIFLSKHFANIRKQGIWGNTYIKVKGQSLLFNNWIDSNLIYINDLLDEKRNLSEEFILKKLKCKVNWISELYTLKKKGLLREWVKILSEENSISSTVNITKDKVIWNNKHMDIYIFTSRLFYNSIIKVKATNPVDFNNWSRHLNLDEKPDMSQIYSFILYFLKENNLQIFR